MLQNAENMHENAMRLPFRTYKQLATSRLLLCGELFRLPPKLPLLHGVSGRGATQRASSELKLELLTLQLAHAT